MNKSKKIGIIALVLCLAIGFAAMTTELIINGGAKLGYNASNFDIYFSSAIAEDGGTADIDQETRKSIEYHTKVLSELGDEAILDYVVTNNSTQYDAKGTIEFTYDSELNEYVDIIKTGFEDNEETVVNAKSSVPGRIKIVLKKRSPDSIHFDFQLKINFEPVNRDSTGEEQNDDPNNPIDDGPTTLSAMILADNEVIVPNGTVPNLNMSSQEAEDPSGLYQMTVTGQGYGGTNNGGTSYYFRGAVENNMVRIGSQEYYIVRINEDGSVRLVVRGYAQVPGGNISYGSPNEDIHNLYYSTSENIKDEVDQWYQDYVVAAGYDQFVVGGNYFCEQAKVTWNDGTYSVPGVTMIPYDEYTPDLKCETDGQGHGLYNSKVGLMTYDEMILAGSYPGQDHKNAEVYYYSWASVYSWWTMSPMGMATNQYASIWRFRPYDGHLEDQVTTDVLGVVPVINIGANVPARRITGTSGQFLYYTIDIPEDDDNEG